MTTEERFDRIESLLERFAENHIELEAAQLNQTKAHEKLVGVVIDLSEKVADLTILVNQLIEKTSVDSKSFSPTPENLIHNDRRRYSSHIRCVDVISIVQV